MNKIKIAFVRHEGFNLSVLWLVEFETEWNDKYKLFRALDRAISAWVETTEEGEKAWDCSADDFNIGDLLSQRVSPLDETSSLRPFLIKEYITAINLLYEHGPDDETFFDKILAHPNAQKNITTSDGDGR